MLKKSLIQEGLLVTLQLPKAKAAGLVGTAPTIMSKARCLVTARNSSTCILTPSEALGALLVKLGKRSLPLFFRSI